MNLKDLKELVKLVDSSNLTEFKFENDDVKIHMKKEILVGHIKDAGVLPVYNESASKAERRETLENDEVINIDTDENVHIIKSPILGTFYASPNPDAPAYVKVGDRIKKGDVLCIIEAMKTMNEINSDVDGEVAEILCENQSAVEYGQSLFKIRKV